MIAESSERQLDEFERTGLDPDVPHLMSAINAIREVEHSENHEIKTGREAIIDMIVKIKIILLQ